MLSFIQPNNNIKINKINKIDNMTNSEISCIIPGELYLTDATNAKDYSVLKYLGIKQILIVGNELSRHGDDQFKVMHIRLEDHPEENIKKYFNITYEFIKQAPTLLHCAMGISRSSTIVASYIIRKYKKTTDEVLAFMKEKRKIINPNYGFINQLKDFEKNIEKAD